MTTLYDSVYVAMLLADDVPQLSHRVTDNPTYSAQSSDNSNQVARHNSHVGHGL